MSSLTLDEARRLVVQHIEPTAIERRALLDAVGLVAARDLHTDMMFPPFDRVAMDGYAVRARETQGASAAKPVRLRVVGSARAGAPFGGEVDPGCCTKAMTGAALPEGLDSVVPVEKTKGYSDNFAEILEPVARGLHVAIRGEDLAEGAVVLEAGRRIAAHHLQALASAGHAEVEVHRPPTCAVLATGDELVAPDEKPAAGQIRESNSYTTAAMLAAYGIQAERFRSVRDDPSQLCALFADVLERFELVVLSGGVSKGEHDYVKDSLRANDVELHFESLLLRPGHPTTFGSRDDAVVFALPGNPVAVAATLSVVFAPGLRRWTGERFEPRAQFARLGFDHRRAGSREQLLPVSLGEPGDDGLPVAASTRHHGSGDFVSLARADAFARFPLENEDFAAGELIRIHSLNQPR